MKLLEKQQKQRNKLAKKYREQKLHQGPDKSKDKCQSKSVQPGHVEQFKSRHMRKSVSRFNLTHKKLKAAEQKLLAAQKVVEILRSHSNRDVLSVASGIDKLSLSSAK